MAGVNTGDVVLAQAQMIAFAIPGAGPGIAAALSIVTALYDWMQRATAAPARYSVEAAIADLGLVFDQELVNIKTEDQVTTILSWQQKRVDFVTDRQNWTTTGSQSIADACEAFFLNDDAFNTVFTALGDIAPSEDDPTPAPPNAPAPVITRDQVEALGRYSMARTAYQSVCVAALQLLARSKDLVPERDWLTVHSPIRSRFEASMQAAIDHLTPIVNMLVDARTNDVARAQAKAASETDTITRNQVFAQEYRRLTLAAHLDASTPAIIDRCQTLLPTFQATLDAVRKQPLTPINPAGPTGGGMGPRAPKTARFVFELGASTWIPVFDDSTVSAGTLVTQDAGSTDVGMYYEVDGGGVNGEFKKALVASGGLKDANDAIATAYKGKYGAGEYDKDSKSPTRQDRLTSFLIPVNPISPVGSTVLAMIYSAGPKLTGPITDTAGYKQIYADALAAIATWSVANTTQVDNFRVTLLSTGIYGGPAVMAQAAGLVIEAVIEALSAPQSPLSTLTILVNSNESAGGLERIAFTTAAAASPWNVTASLQGFDVPFS